MTVRYISTRGAAPELNFADAMLAGLATDGGLYVPDVWPSLAPTWVDTALQGYVGAAVEVMWPFVDGSIDRVDFESIVAEAYATFDDPLVAPLTDLGDGLWLMELFHGPTLAFKDVALQLLGRLMDYELGRRGQRVTVIGATSGDTGSAAIEALRDRSAIDVIILYPAGRVSDVQRRQMTTVDAPNVHNVAIDGTFDDCQDLLKAAFGQPQLRDRFDLAAVNSINWARVMAQTVYYVTAAAHVGKGEPVSFAVPTGNFGNVFAGYGALRMGLPIHQLVIGSNRNDILTRFFTSGSMDITDVYPTLSPSMDIQVSSNLERLLFELNGRDGIELAESMLRFRSEGSVTVPEDQLAGASEVFTAARLDDDGTLAVIRDLAAATGVTVDPHTAVGIAAARSCRRDPDVPMVALATAHPAKFPDAVEQATGERPGLPDRLADLFEREERVSELPADLDRLVAFLADVTGR